MAEIHPGARLFSEAARRAVAEGELFATDHVRPSDGCCVVGALLRAQWPDHMHEAPTFPDNAELADFLIARGVIGVLTAYNDYAEIRPTLRLVNRNDRGEYADRTNLRRDLLGIEGGDER